MIVCDLFDCQFVSDHIAPVAIKMAYDRVAHVRDSASKLVSCVLQFRLAADGGVLVHVAFFRGEKGGYE